jgi:hypothetical protein
MTALTAFAVGVALGYLASVLVAVLLTPRGQLFGEPYDVFEDDPDP